MSILDQLGGVLGQFGGGNLSEEHAPAQFQQVASQVPRGQLGGLLSSIFRSPDTGSFGDNISQMFGRSDPQQRAGILNQLLGAAGPGILSNFLPGAGGHVTPEQAQQLSPEDAKQIAEHAARQNPGVIEKAGEFYSQHPQLVQALGAGVALWALQRFPHRT